MTSRVIAPDLDGTLLTPQKTLLPLLLRPSNEPVKRGINSHRNGSTSRSHSSFYQALGLDTPAICCNGTYLNSGNIVQKPLKHTTN